MLELDGIYVEVTELPIDAAQAMVGLGDRGHGAQTLFLGVVRDHNQGRKVLGMSYDAFAPLVEKIFLSLCLEARERWGSALRFSVIHRTGRLKIGEISVSIAVSSPHRDEAYQASRYVIEQLKVRAPIWKQEHYEDGDSKWLKGHALCSHSHEESHLPK